MYTVTWDDSREEAASIDAVELILDRLHRRFQQADEATLVTVERPGGAALSIGLGSDASVLNHVRSDGDPPYHTSVGGDEGDETFWFSYHGSPSEFPQRQIVPIATARGVMRRFCETGELADVIAWEEV